jgi:spore coat polysaccharide biosynthesis protein SpsF (cytidylyltransferase family)
VATGIIVQARTGSTRLPGKVLADLAGAPALIRLFERLKRVGGGPRIVLATSALPADDPVAELARQTPGIDLWRGPEQDVLKRYADAARHFDLDPVIRITGDCPLIEPDTIEAVLARFGSGAFDYADNLVPRTFAHGCDVQVVSRKALEIADREAVAADEREHVLPFVNRRPERFAAVHVTRDGTPCPELRITLDYPEDLVLIRAIYERLYTANPAFGLEDILALRAAEPALFEVNAARRQV